MSTDDRAPEEIEAEAWADRLGLNEQAVHGVAKRLGMEWTPWMGDWFTSWSPRNSNSHGEGTWDHWVDLALSILSDPLTAIVRPDVHDMSLAGKRQNFYDQSNRRLTYVELRKRFERPAEEASGDL